MIGVGKCVCGKDYPDDWTVHNIRGKDGKFRTVIPAHWPKCYELAKSMSEKR